jgi:hypothetical protein
MFCPNCGQKTNFEQIYCRSCGTELSETSHKISKYYAGLEEKIDWLKRTGLFSIGVVLGVALIFLVILFHDAFRLEKGPVILFFMGFSVVLMGVVSVLYFEKRQSKKIKAELLQDKHFAPSVLEMRSTNRELNESSFQPIGSVTDYTTELFTSKIPRARTSGELG